MLAIGPWGGIDRQKRLADIVDDQIDAIGRTFLGLTLACARCHDHKFDPISTADYYGLAGFFFSSRILPDQAYLSHTAPRLKVPLASAVEVEEHRRRTARVQELEDRLQAAVDRHYATFCPRPAAQGRGLLAGRRGIIRNRPAGQARVSAEQFAQPPRSARVRPATLDRLPGTAPRGRLPSAGSARPQLRWRAGHRGLDGQRRTPLVGV